MSDIHPAEFRAYRGMVPIFYCLTKDLLTQSVKHTIPKILLFGCVTNLARYFIQNLQKNVSKERILLLNNKIPFLKKKRLSFRISSFYLR